MKRTPATRNHLAVLRLAPCICLMLLMLFGISCDDGYYYYDERTLDTPRHQPSAFTITIPSTMYADTAGKLTILYCLAAVNPDQVPDFVRENRAAFADVGQLQQGAAAFRQNVIAVVIRSPSRNEMYASAMSVAGSDPQLGEWAGKVADDQTKALADLMLLSDHLIDLSNAVNEILQGNDGPYHQTLIYQAMKLVYDMGGFELLGSTYLVYVCNVGYQSTYPLVAIACQ